MQQPKGSSVDDEPFPAPAFAGSINLRRVLPLFLLGALIVTSAGCDSGAKLPQRSSKEYGNVVSAFYVGLAALQVGNDVQAESNSPPAGRARHAVDKEIRRQIAGNSRAICRGCSYARWSAARGSTARCRQEEMAKC